MTPSSVFQQDPTDWERRMKVPAGTARMPGGPWGDQRTETSSIIQFDGQPENPRIAELDGIIRGMTPQTKKVLFDGMAGAIPNAAPSQAPGMISPAMPPAAPVAGQPEAQPAPLTNLRQMALPPSYNEVGAPSLPGMVGVSQPQLREMPDASAIDPGMIPGSGGYQLQAPKLPGGISPRIGRSGPSARESEYDRLVKSGSGASQIKNPWARIPLQIADAIGSSFFPGISMALPGTELHHRMLVNDAADAVDAEQGILDNESERELRASQVPLNEANTRHADAEAEGMPAEAELRSAQAQHYLSEIEAKKNPALKVLSQPVIDPADPKRTPRIGYYNEKNGQVVYGPEATAVKRDDTSQTPFEVWRQQNPNGKVEDYLKMEGASKGRNMTAEDILMEEAQKPGTHPPTLVAEAKRQFGEKHRPATNTFMMPPVAPGADGGPNSTVKGYASYRMAMPPRPTNPRNQNAIKAWDEMYDAVTKANPSYSFTGINTMKDFAGGGKMSQSLNAINTAAGHLSDLNAALKALDRGDVGLLNQVAQAYSRQTGGTVQATADTIIPLLSKEIAKVYVATGGTADERDEIQNSFNTSKGYNANRAALAATTKMFASKMNAMKNTFEVGAPGAKWEDHQFVSPAAQAVFDSLTGTQQQQQAGGGVQEWGRDAQGRPVRVRK